MDEWNTIRCDANDKNTMPLKEGIKNVDSWCGEYMALVTPPCSATATNRHHYSHPSLLAAPHPSVYPFDWIFCMSLVERF